MSTLPSPAVDLDDWFDGIVEAREEVAPGLVHLRVRAPRAVLASFGRAGQFQRLSADGGVTTGRFALASAPGASSLEYLVRSGAGAAALGLSGLERGAPLAMSRAQGRGFPLDEVGGRPLLLVAVGSGLAPIRSVLLALEQRRAPIERVSLYYGVNTPRDFPFRHELLSWEQCGIEVLRSVTIPDAGWSGPTGFIQRHLDGPPLPADTVVFLVGQKEMLHEARERLMGRGVQAPNLHVNF